MPRELLARLESWKRCFGPPETGELERLLEQTARRRYGNAGDLIRLHETLLFLRAYPRTPQVARLADRILASFADRVAELAAADADLSPFEEPEVSGIAGTTLSAIFGYDVARQLARLHPGQIEIAWDRYQDTDRMAPVLSRLLPLLREDWPVEAHAPLREWIAADNDERSTDLAWLLAKLGEVPAASRDRAEEYESMGLPLTWQIGTSSRSTLRLERRTLYCHRDPLIQRRDVSLHRELLAPKIPVRRLSRPEARRMLDLIVDTSAMRYRELYGFSHPDEKGVSHADLGRGVEVVFFGVPPQWRLPLRAYHAGMFFKNGVPAGYVELLSLFERAEVGFNLYYTFREGESAWLYARLLHLFKQVLGVNCFSVDPYQIGFQNPEAVNSGAFWFYRKLGFRPVEPAIAELVEGEERRIRDTPGYRSSKPTLEKLARGYILFDGPGAEGGAWDRFRIRTVALAVQRAASKPVDGLAAMLEFIPGRENWTKDESRAAAEIIDAKSQGAEARYLRLMQRHPRLRAGFLRLGSSPQA
jgi:hypothetical protein